MSAKENAENHINRNQQPSQIKRRAQNEKAGVNQSADNQANQPENKPENISDNGIILVKGLENIFQGNPPRQNLIELAENLQVAMAENKKTINIPMMKKCFDPVEKIIGEMGKRRHFLLE